MRKVLAEKCHNNNECVLHECNVSYEFQKTHQGGKGLPFTAPHYYHSVSIKPTLLTITWQKVRTAGPPSAPPVVRSSPTRQTHQKPLHSLCKMVQLKGIDLQVNTMVVICERMVFDFNWLLQSNHWL